MRKIRCVDDEYPIIEVGLAAKIGIWREKRTKRDEKRGESEEMREKKRERKKEKKEKGRKKRQEKENTLPSTW